MKDLLEYIIKGLASKPEEVVINEETEETIINLQLSVAPEDMGIVIGKSGQTIRAIRRLLVARAVAENRNQRVNVNLQEAGK